MMCTRNLIAKVLSFPFESTRERSTRNYDRHTEKKTTISHALPTGHGGVAGLSKTLCQTTPKLRADFVRTKCTHILSMQTNKQKKKHGTQHNQRKFFRNAIHSFAQICSAGFGVETGRDRSALFGSPALHRTAPGLGELNRTFCSSFAAHEAHLLGVKARAYSAILYNRNVQLSRRS